MTSSADGALHPASTSSGEINARDLRSPTVVSQPLHFQAQPLNLPSPDSTLSWVQTLTANKAVFPTEQGRGCEWCYLFHKVLPADVRVIFWAVPPEFETISQRIYVQLLMLFAHIYHQHFQDLVHMEAEGHLNSFAAHYISSCIYTRIAVSCF